MAGIKHRDVAATLGINIAPQLAFSRLVIAKSRFHLGFGGVSEVDDVLRIIPQHINDIFSEGVGIVTSVVNFRGTALIVAVANNHSDGAFVDEFFLDDDKLDTAINIILDVTTADDKAIGRIFTSTIDDSINIATHKNRSDAVA